MQALIDGDILVYRIGFGCEAAPEFIALRAVDEEIGKILQFLGTTDYQCFLTSTDKSNFRFELYPEYKAGRKSKPRHYDLIRSHLLEVHGAEQAYGQEADDLLGIAQSQGTDTIICTIDKDLDQVPGMHFNWVRGQLYEVNEEQGNRSFYTQILTGDKVDNIPGIPKCGPVSAARYLAGLSTASDLHTQTTAVYAKYYAAEGDQGIAIHTRNAKLLWIRRHEQEIWQPPPA